MVPDTTMTRAAWVNAPLRSVSWTYPTSCSGATGSNVTGFTA
jgi:hypothetical protein